MIPPPVPSTKSIGPVDQGTGGGVTVKIAAIIPARMASIRFPGKPLVEIEGLPMIEHVRRRALLCKEFSQVVVATCDEDIANVVRSFGGEVLMTSANHQVATERIIEAMKQMDCTHFVNVQGDEVLVLSSDLDKIAGAIQKNPQNGVWNAVAKIENKEALEDPSVVKCVISKSGRILWFSRHFSDPSFPDSNSDGSIYWVIGLLAYSRSVLERFQSFARTPVEAMESIEQIRFLENDIPIFSVLLKKAYPGVNEPREIHCVKTYLREDPRQREVLERILRR